MRQKESRRARPAPPSRPPWSEPGHATRRIDRAREIVSAELAPTPLVASPAAHGSALLKLETWQPTGSFKVRGALAALTGRRGTAGIVTASTGNHALAMAYVAARLGIPASVVVPRGVAPAKLEALRRFPAEIVMHGASYESAEEYAKSLAGPGRDYISPYNDPDIISGQATLGLELADQLGEPFTVVCSVGGGGLASGLGLAASRSRRMTVIGVESAQSRAVSAAVSAGQVVQVDVGPTLADGIAGNLEPGSVTVDLIAAHVRALVAVTDAEIRAAIRYLAVEHGLVAEGAGAAPVAAILAGKITVPGHLVAVVGGRNITPEDLGNVLAGLG